MVTRGGSSWRAKHLASGTSNLDKDPMLADCDSYWEKFASKGDAGPPVPMVQSAHKVPLVLPVQMGRPVRKVRPVPMVSVTT